MKHGLAWDELHVVLAVARSGSLAAAASTLGVDPTTIGRRIGAIHDRVGYTLFERAGTALAVTPSARHLIADLEAMEAAALAAERKLAATATPRGPVRIAATDAFTSYFLLPELARMSDELPDIQVELVASHALADLRRREADVALRFVRPDSNELRARRIASMRWSLYGSVDYLRSRARVDVQRGLAGHDVIRWGGPALRQTVAAWLDVNARAARTVLVTEQLHVMIEACAAGFGLAAAPGSLALGRGLARAIDHAIFENELWLVVHRDLRKVPRVRAVASWLGARLAASAERISMY